MGNSKNKNKIYKASIPITKMTENLIPEF
jgi:hypothetical protein